MKNIAMRLRYDGTNYHGWQTQRSGKTVEDTIERALRRLTGESVRVIGCGRTDAGVHALSYCANFKSDTRIPPERLPMALNSALPPDISVCAAMEAPEDFNAILSCEKKEYTYRIVNSRIRDPFLMNRAYFYPVELDETTMRDAASRFVGTHDFAAVRSVGTNTKTTVRTVYYCDIERSGIEIRMKICADGFLYNMARAIMGTVIYCAEGKLSANDLPALLASGDRRLAGPTAPPQGLYMTRLWYNGAVGRLMDGEPVF